MAAWNFQVIEIALSEAALNPLAWTQVLDVVTEQTGARGTILIPTGGGSSPLPCLPFSEALAETTETYFREGWHLRDERMAGLPLMKKNNVFDDLDLFDEAEMRKRAYYQEFLAPLGLKFFAGVDVAVGNEHWCLSIQRQTGSQPFSPAEKTKLRRLSRSASSAAMVSHAFGFGAAQAALSAFELSGVAVLLFDRAGNVIAVNPTTEALLHSDLTVQKGRLTSRDSNATRLLERALSELLYRRCAMVSQGPILLPRTGRSPLVLYLLRPSSICGSLLFACQCIGILTDPEARAEPSAQLLRALYGLTSAETKVARNMAIGLSPATIAAKYALSVDTVRNQVKSIFEKTGVHSQGELIPLLLALPNGSYDQF